MNIDLPYQSEWFEYYDKLGIDRYYLYYHEKEGSFYDLESHLSYFPKEKVRIQRIPLKPEYNPNQLWIDYPFSIEEDYILHVDSDEFLYLQKMNLRQFISKFPNVHYFSFLWYMCPSFSTSHASLNEILEDRTLPKYFVNYYKSMALRSHISFMGNNSHDFMIQKPVNRLLFSNDCFIIHFSYRNLYDGYYKTYFQHIKNHEDTHLNKVDFINHDVKEITCNKIPSRIITYLGEIENKNTHVYIPLHLPIQSRTNLELLESFEEHKEKFELFVKRFHYMRSLHLFVSLHISNKFIKKTIIDYSKYIRFTIPFPE